MVNKVILVGRLGQKPEIRNGESGIVANFSVATSEKYTDKNGTKKEHTEWHRISVWGALAEICGKYLDKGRLVYVEGKLRTKKFTDKSGQEKTYTEIIANSVQFLSGEKDHMPKLANTNSQAIAQAVQPFRQNMQTDMPPF